MSWNTFLRSFEKRFGVKNEKYEILRQFIQVLKNHLDRQLHDEMFTISSNF